MSPSARLFTYVAIGASDSVGEGSSDPPTKSWPALLATRFPAGTSYRNLGVSGSTVAEAIVQQLPQALRADPDVVSVWLAFNDLAQQVDPAAYRRDLERLLDALLARPRAKIFVANLPDLRGVPATPVDDPQALAAAVAAYDGIIADVVRARAARTVLVDLYEGSADVIAHEVVVAPDGLHPNDRGYQLIAERFAEVMRREGVPIR